MSRLISHVMVAPLLIGGPRRYLVTAAYGVALLLAGLLWVVAPVALWKSFGMAWSLLWLLPTTILVFAVARPRAEMEEVPAYVTWTDLADDEPAEECDLPEGYYDWLDDIMKPPPKWYRVCQWLSIALFAVLFAVVVLEQWFLWMLVMVELVDPWAIVIGASIAAFQMLLLFREKPRRAAQSV